MDIDPVAVAQCRHALSSLCPPMERERALTALHKNIRVGDGVAHDWGKCTFDAVVSNPPWCNISLHPDTKQSYLQLSKELYPLCCTSSRRKLNTSHFFLEMGARLLRSGGRFLFILPDSLLLSDMCHRLFASPKDRQLRIHSIVTIPVRNVWPFLTEHGAISIVGDKESSAISYDYFHAGWPRSGRWVWQLVNSTSALAVKHLCPHYTWCRVIHRFKRQYQSTPWLSCSLGPMHGHGKSVTEPTSNNVMLQKGSVFHLRYLCDNFACFPRRNEPVWVIPSVHCSLSRWLLLPDRPDVVAVPLFMDRGHPHKDQLRACILPKTVLVDSTTSLHWDRENHPHATYFLLGFWNSRTVEHLMVMGTMAPCGKWMRLSHMKILPFPENIQMDWSPHTMGAAEEAFTVLVLQDRVLPSHLKNLHADTISCLVANVARCVESVRMGLAHTIAEHASVVTQPLQKWICWAWLTGATQRPGVLGECPKMQCVGAFAERCAGVRKEYQRLLGIIDAAVAALYEYQDSEYLSIMHDLVPTDLHRDI